MTIFDTPCSDRRHRRRGRLHLALALGAGLLAGSGAALAQPLGTLIVAQPVDIITMDPAMYRSRETENVVRQVNNALVMSSPTLKPLPELAISWQAIDPLTWEFKLREGVNFTNGEPFDAEAVKFTFDRLIDPNQKSPRKALIASLVSTEIVDAHTVRFHTSEPTATFPMQMTTQEIVPPKYLKEVGDEQFAKAPIGTGPFIFESWTPNQEVVLRANPDYWDGAPALEKLIFRPIPELAARVAALQAGEVQIASNISPDLAPTLTGNVTAKSVSGTNMTYLAMNVTKPPFDQVAVRRAVQQAIDVKGIVDALYLGQGEVLNQLAFKAMDGYDPDYPGIPYDPAAAKEVLSAVSTPVVIDTGEGRKTLAEAIAGQLRQAGLKVSINVIDGPAFTSAVNSGNTQAYVAIWGFGKGDSDAVFSTHFHSAARALQFFSGFSDPEIDKLIVEARAASFNPEKAKPLYAELNRRVMEAAPWVPIVTPNDIFGASTRVVDWEPSPDGRINVAKTSLR